VSGERAQLLLLTFLLALVVRLAYQVEIRDLPTQHQLVMDAQRYDALARGILAGGWLPREPFYQAPLYPYLLALVYAACGRSLVAVRLVQALLGALTAVLAAVVASRLSGREGRNENAGRRDGSEEPSADSALRDASGHRSVEAARLDGGGALPADMVRLRGSGTRHAEVAVDRASRRRWVAGIAGVLAALYAPAIFYTPLLLKTVPTLLLESAALMALLPPRGRAHSSPRALAAGLLLGAAALLQESLLLLAPAAALFVTLWPGPSPTPRTCRDEAAPTRNGDPVRTGRAVAMRFRPGAPAWGWRSSPARQSLWRRRRSSTWRPAAG
jgi:hypothetical protein